MNLVAAVSCLAAIVGLLIKYDGERQASWSNSALTLNGLVALLATFCRTFFMFSVGAALAQGKWIEHSGRQDHFHSRLEDFALFEHASKGPWGAMKLIWRFKGG